MRLLVQLIVLVSFLIFVGWIVGGLYLDSAVKNGIETIGPKIMGTTVTVEKVSISVISGRGRVNGLVIGNPKGFDTDSSYRLANTRVKVDLPSVLSGKLIIEEIVLESPEITYEGSSSGSNLARIRKNAKAFNRTHGSKKTKGTDSQDNGVRPLLVQINHFIVKDPSLNYSPSLFGGRALTFQLDDLHLRNIGKKSGGVTFDEATSQVLAGMNRPILSSISGFGKKEAKRVKATRKASKRSKRPPDTRVADFLKKVSQVYESFVNAVKSIFGKEEKGAAKGAALVIPDPRAVLRFSAEGLCGLPYEEPASGVCRRQSCATSG